MSVWGERKCLDSGQSEVREVGPVANLRGIATDANPLGVGGCGAVEDEHLEPTGRRDFVVGRSNDGTRIAVAGELGEESTSVHGVAVSGRRSCNKLVPEHFTVAEKLRTCNDRDSHGRSCALGEVDGEGIRATVLPFGLGDSEVGLNATFGEVGRNVHLDSHFLGEPGCLWVASRDQDTTIRQKLKVIVRT